MKDGINVLLKHLGEIIKQVITSGLIIGPFQIGFSKIFIYLEILINHQKRIAKYLEDLMKIVLN